MTVTAQRTGHLHLALKNGTSTVNGEVPVADMRQRSDDPTLEHNVRMFGSNDNVPLIRVVLRTFQHQPKQVLEQVLEQVFQHHPIRYRAGISKKPPQGGDLRKYFFSVGISWRFPDEDEVS